MLCHSCGTQIPKRTNVSTEVPSCPNCGRRASSRTSQPPISAYEQTDTSLPDVEFPSRLFGLIFTGVGLILWAICLGFSLYSLNTLQGTTTTQGRIISCPRERQTSDQGSASDTCQPTVRFTTASGEKIDFVASFYDNSPHEGDEVTVYYHPDHPQNAFLFSFMALWFVPLISGVIGLPFVGVGLSFLVGPSLRKLFERRGEPQTPDMSESMLEISTLAASSTRGHYALGGADGLALESGDRLAILIGKMWIYGQIAYSAGIYANQGRQKVSKISSKPRLLAGYYFIADDDGHILGLCVGMKVRRLN